MFFISIRNIGSSLHIFEINPAHTYKHFICRIARQLTTGEGLCEHFGGEGSFGTDAASLFLEKVLPQHVSPAAIEETVKNVRGDDFRHGATLRFVPRFQHKSIWWQY